jgi:hypothetical protein
MLRKWIPFFSILFLAHCQTSLDTFDPDATPDEQDPREDAADTADSGDAVHDPHRDDGAPDVPVDQPVDDAATDPYDAPPDQPVDVVQDDVITDVPVDDVPVDVPPDDMPPDDVLSDDVAVDDVRPDDVPPETFERCDNGFDDDGDGRIDCMDGDCLLAAGCAGTCYPLSTIACGSSITGTNLDPYATDRIVQASCQTWDSWTGPEVAYTFTLPERRSVVINLSGLADDLDLFLLGNGAGRCDGSDCLKSSIAAYADPERIDMTLDPGTYYVLVDGYYDHVSAFNLSVTCNPPEICNNSRDDDGDGLADCADPDCDAFPACIDYCSPVAFVNCGTLLSSSTTGSGSTNTIGAYGCASYEETGPEIAYAFMSMTGGSVTFTIDTLSTTMLDLFVLEDDGGHCNPQRCIDYSATDNSNDYVTITASPGAAYYVVIDGYSSASGTFRIGVTCY